MNFCLALVCFFFLFFKDKIPLVDPDETMVIANGEINPSQKVLVQENQNLLLSCYGNGNPNSTIRLSQQHGVIRTLDTNTGKLLKHTIEQLQCSDSDIYKCTWISPGFSNIEREIRVSVQCELLLFEITNLNSRLQLQNFD